MLQRGAKNRCFNSLNVNWRGQLSTRLLLGERLHVANTPKLPVPLPGIGHPLVTSTLLLASISGVFPPGCGVHTNTKETGDALDSVLLHFRF